MLKFLIISSLLILISFNFVRGGIVANEKAIGFLLNNNQYSEFYNQIPANYIQSYLNFLGVNDLRFSTINLPSGNSNNDNYQFNIINNSILRRVEARIGNNLVNNPWEITVDQNNNYHLTFARVVNDINFSQPAITNPGNNYIATTSWDPNISGSVAWGISYSRNIYKVYKDGSNIITQQVYTGNEPQAGIASTLGDFNNDGKADLFVIKTNENNAQPTKVNEAAVFVQGNNETFSKTVLNTNNWDQGQNKVDVKWTAGAVVANYQKWDQDQNKYIFEKFDYNNDGKQDVLIASADGAVYVVPNTTNGQQISFGSPIKVVTTGVRTGEDGSYNGSQVVSMGDINKDGIPDIVVGSTDSAKLYIFYGRRNNQGNIYFGLNTNVNQQSNPDIVIYNSTVQGNDKIVNRSNNLESSEYKGPSNQTHPNGNPPVSDYTGGATNIVLADINRDGELDILVATDNWQFRPTKLGNTNFDLQIKHHDRNGAILSKVGGRVFLIVGKKTNNQLRYKNYFLGQYAITNDNQNADFDNATLANFSGPTSLDFIATDGNHAQTLFSFLQAGSGFVAADEFTIESKDLIRKGGNSTKSFNFNNNSFYIRNATITISGEFRGIPTTISLANRIENNNPIYVNIPIPSNLLNNVFTNSNPLVIEVNFYPSDPNIIYRINNGPWQSTNVNRMRGNSLVYRITFDTSDQTLRQTITSLTREQISSLNRTVDITNIDISYIAEPQSLKVSNWKEVR